ncbi:MAG: ADYC domain-containing protein, partial [Myxococcota bacterium]|nr:ADYC domain-containing protein [Myxococcota bacterium]
LNGVSLNGVSLNGVSLNGVSLNGVSLNGVSLNGTRTDDGSQLTVESIGPTLTAILSNGATVPIKIESATQLAGANSDVWSYGIAYQSDTGWTPLCGDGVGALAVAGVWNTDRGVAGGGAYTATPSSFTFACRGKTIAKCIELGYKTWTGRTAELTSCVRLLRGDFCGDGTPYTVDGTTLNIYDHAGIQTDTESWAVEAEWTPNGARCISEAQLTRSQQQLGIAPSCAASLSSGAACGTFANGGLLISELP